MEYKLVSVVTIVQRTPKPVAPPEPPYLAEWRWLGMQVVVATNETGGESRDAWHTFGLYQRADLIK